MLPFASLLTVWPRFVSVLPCFVLCVDCLSYIFVRILVLLVLHRARSSSSFCDGHGLRVYVCACVCHASRRDERIISREVQACCAGGRAIQSHTFTSRFQKQPRSHGHNDISGTTVQRQQQQAEKTSKSVNVGFPAQECTDPAHPHTQHAHSTHA